jgi:ubiquinol-cytochrome c reductase iron-sulfur subunit
MMPAWGGNRLISSAIPLSGFRPTGQIPYNRKVCESAQGFAVRRASAMAGGDRGRVVMADDTIDRGKRRFLVGATSVVGGVGVVSTATPFVMSLFPSERAKAAGAPVDVDIGKLEPGQKIDVEWRGKVVWIINRTPPMLESLPKLDPKLADPNSNVSQQTTRLQERAPLDQGQRAGVDRHLHAPRLLADLSSRGRPADLGPDWLGGFFCPCHQSKFDLAGRVYSGVPAPTNLPVPPHRYLQRRANSRRRRNEGVVKASTMQRLLTWIDERFPLTALWESQWGKYVAPKNFNFWYYFGSLAAFALVVQIVTGIFLTMNYKPDATKAFESVEYIMRDVSWGWLIRYMHSTGASMFFIVVYLHMFRGLLYGSYRKPRELTWIFGCVIYLCLMAEAFFGYLLPWGQMSYWGAQVIVNLFSTVPVIGEDLGVWIRGDYTISDITLNRFFAST